MLKSTIPVIEELIYAHYFYKNNDITPLLTHGHWCSYSGRVIAYSASSARLPAELHLIIAPLECRFS